MSFSVLCFRLTLQIITVIPLLSNSVAAYYNTKNFECGPYGFVCEGKTKLRLCGGDDLMGPSFLCPSGTLCNEDSSDVCENAINFIDPSMRTIRCRRNERIADPNVPGCKGYILCIPNKNRFQGIKFKCSGSTVFNGFTRTCSAPDKYTCPLGNTTKSVVDLYEGDKRRIFYNEEYDYKEQNSNIQNNRPIDCKNYKFRVTHDNSPVRATYFCPQRPARIGAAIKCTVFSNNFCLILERDDEDQFLQSAGIANRRPRTDSTKMRV